jgi:hypothetical protein
VFTSRIKYMATSSTEAGQRVPVSAAGRPSKEYDSLLIATLAGLWAIFRAAFEMGPDGRCSHSRRGAGLLH